MKITANNIKIQFNELGQVEIILTLNGNRQELLTEISKAKSVIEDKKLLSVEINKYRLKRSLDANSYLWVLCQKIAEKIHSTKELVYKTFIKRVGQFEIIPIKNEAVKRWIEVWESKGLGWIAEEMDKTCKIDGYKKVISYYGSSVYDSKEMCVLIDEIVQECKILGIETMTNEELQSLKDNWDK